MKKVLIAGATGYLGMYAVREFKRRGWWVRALARDPGKLEPLENEIDHTFVGEATNAKTLNGICDGVDVVFSSLGITRQRDKAGYFDVDYGANHTILEMAQNAGVKKFIFVSVLNPSVAMHLDICKAREKFVRELKESGMDYTVIRPTGYFSDIAEIFDMAREGRVFLIGNGQKRLNPIHGEDLAAVCVDAVESKEREIPVGGPDIFSYKEIAMMAFNAIGRPPRITTIPVWLVNLIAKVIGIFSRRSRTIMLLMAAFFTNDMIAPSTGTHKLSDFFNEIRRG